LIAFGEAVATFLRSQELPAGGLVRGVFGGEELVRCAECRAGVVLVVVCAEFVVLANVLVGELVVDDVLVVVLVGWLRAPPARRCRGRRSFSSLPAAPTRRPACRAFARCRVG
jgi:hypothetical protein